MFKNIEKTALITGAALGLTATAVFPIMKSTLMTLGIMGVKGTLSLVESTKTTLQLAKEEVQDIIAEAQFQRLSDQLDKEISNMPEDKPEAT